MKRRSAMGAVLRAAALGVGAGAAAGLGSAARNGYAAAASSSTATARVDYAPVLRSTRLAFPRDHGAHPRFRTEWWYVTGWLRSGSTEFGVQVTFFRARTAHDDANPSRFAPTQLLMAHAALAMPGANSLVHEQRAARAGLELASASEADCDLRIGRWSLARAGDDSYRARIVAERFELDLAMRPPAAPLLQGERGFSRKGPRPEQASHYYSRPQLALSATVRAGDARPIEARGTGWLDHEWSSELLDPAAAGWDWIGINLDDGDALMAFRIRARDGTTIWSHARLTSAGDVDVAHFEPIAHWRSLRTGASYPVGMRVRANGRTFDLHPLLDDQELDARASTGIVYWEGAVRAFEGGREVGRGYLELTGYASPVRL